MVSLLLLCWCCTSCSASVQVCVGERLIYYRRGRACASLEHWACVKLGHAIGPRHQKTWSFCESSFCVDRGGRVEWEDQHWEDWWSTLRGFSILGTFCMKMRSPIVDRPRELCCPTIPVQNTRLHLVIIIFIGRILIWTDWKETYLDNLGHSCHAGSFSRENQKCDSIFCVTNHYWVCTIHCALYLV